VPNHTHLHLFSHHCLAHRGFRRLITAGLGGLSLGLGFGFGMMMPIAPAAAQVFTPHRVELDAEQLEYIGLGLLQDADRLARFQQLSEALPRAELASQLLPENAQVWAILGTLYIQDERFEAGLAALMKARALEPENAAIRFTLGSAYFQNKNYDQAIEELSAGLDLMPNTPGALFDLGNVYFVTGDFAQAIEQYESAHEQSSDFWPALNNLGLVRYEMGQRDQAVELWKQSSTVAPQEAEPMLARAAALYAQGDRTTGLDLAEQALRLDVRYADLEFLALNLWGQQLLESARQLLANPRLQAIVAQTEAQPITIPLHP